MEKYPDFWSIVIGPGPLGVYLGLIVVALITAAVSLLVESSTRKVISADSPIKFSWHFLLTANGKRIIANFLAVPVLIRIIYPMVTPELMILAAAGVGAIIDRTALWLRDLGILSNKKAANRLNTILAPGQPIVGTPQPK